MGLAVEKPAGQPVGSVADLVDALRCNSLLSEAQFRELGHEKKGATVKELAGRLLQRGWLTSYQVNQLMQGRIQALSVGSYLLLERIGEGGAGKVFKARHRKMDRVVALKIIREELVTDAEAMGRFYREIEVLSRLDHPNVVHAYDAGPVGATHFLAMEYVEGTDLGRLVKKGGRLPTAQACEYIRQAALGLQHAHERGLVHRDIKPHNLIMSLREGLVKVADLGLARLPRAVNHEATAVLTGNGTGTLTPANAVLIGTVDYLAPEQALEFHQADIRADIYSLGCTLYYLLTGQPPFSGGTLAQKVVKHLQQPPPAIDQFRSDLPSGLAAVLHKMLAKRPEDRYQTPAEVSQALAEYGSPNRAASATGHLVQRSPADAMTRKPFLRRWALRRWLVAGGLAIILACLVLWLRLSPTAPYSTASPFGDAKAIIDKAIKAGGDHTRFKARTWSEKGTNYETGPYTAQLAMQFPDQFCLKARDTIVIVDRDKGWLVGGNTTKEMTKELLASQKENLYGVWVASLLPLNGKEYTFAPLGESMVDDRAVVGVTVSSNSHRDVLLYFDKTTYLLAKSVQMVQAEDLWGEFLGHAPPNPRLVKHEAFYSDHRAVQGIQIPMKMVIRRDGKLFVESEKHDIRLVEKLDDKEFSKP
jgi:serine/threonine protein kinase